MLKAIFRPAVAALLMMAAWMANAATPTFTDIVGTNGVTNRVVGSGGNQRVMVSGEMLQPGSANLTNWATLATNVLSSLTSGSSNQPFFGQLTSPGLTQSFGSGTRTNVIFFASLIASNMDAGASGNGTFPYSSLKATNAGYYQFFGGAYLSCTTTVSLILFTNDIQDNRFIAQSFPVTEGATADIAASLSGIAYFPADTFVTFGVVTTPSAAIGVNNARIGMFKVDSVGGGVSSSSGGSATNAVIGILTNSAYVLQTGATNINFIGATGMVSGGTAIIGGFSGGGGDAGGTNSRQFGSASLTNLSGNPNVATNISGAGTVTVTSNNLGGWTITGSGSGDATNIFSGNTVFVDQRNGNDTTATRTNLAKPAATIAKANQISLYGDTIIIRPGTYDEASLTTNGRNYILEGASVRYTGAATKGLIDDFWGPITNSVTGSGQIWMDGANDNNVAAVVSSNALTRILIDGPEVLGLSISGQQPAIKMDGGTVRVRSPRIEGSQYGLTDDDVYGIWFSGGDLVVDALEIIGEKHGIYVTGTGWGTNFILGQVQYDKLVVNAGFIAGHFEAPVMMGAANVFTNGNEPIISIQANVVRGRGNPTGGIVVYSGHLNFSANWLGQTNVNSPVWSHGESPIVMFGGRLTAKVGVVAGLGGLVAISGGLFDISVQRFEDLGSTVYPNGIWITNAQGIIRDFSVIKTNGPALNYGGTNLTIADAFISMPFNSATNSAIVVRGSGLVLRDTTIEAPALAPAITADSAQGVTTEGLTKINRTNSPNITIGGLYELNGGLIHAGVGGFTTAGGITNLAGYASFAFGLFTDNVTIQDGLTVDGISTLTGNVTANGGVRIAGAGGLSVATGITNDTLYADFAFLTVREPATFQDSIQVAGIATMDNSVIFNGPIIDTPTSITPTSAGVGTADATLGNYFTNNAIVTTNILVAGISVGQTLILDLKAAPGILTTLNQFAIGQYLGLNTNGGVLPAIATNGTTRVVIHRYDSTGTNIQVSPPLYSVLWVGATTNHVTGEITPPIYQSASAVLSNLVGLASTVFTNVPLGGTNISVRTAGGTNFIDTTGELNNWASYPTNVWNSRQGGSAVLSNLVATGAFTNAFISGWGNALSTNSGVVSVVRTNRASSIATNATGVTIDYSDTANINEYNAWFHLTTNLVVSPTNLVVGRTMKVYFDTNSLTYDVTFTNTAANPILWNFNNSTNGSTTFTKTNSMRARAYLTVETNGVILGEFGYYR